MRRVSLLSIILFMVISCVFDTTVRNIANLNFEFYLSFMISVTMELPADLLSIVDQLVWPEVVLRPLPAVLRAHDGGLRFF